jgi:hypothetical protein
MGLVCTVARAEGGTGPVLALGQWEVWDQCWCQGSGDGACVYSRQGSGRDGASIGARVMGGMGPVQAPGQWGWRLCVHSLREWEGRGQYRR